MKKAEINLPYFKQGDDLNNCLEQSKTIEDGLALHASFLKQAADQLLKIRQIISEKLEISIYADAHHIGISGPDEVINMLVDSQLADFVEYD